MIYSIYVFVDDKDRPYYVGKTNSMVRRKKEHKELILKGDKLPKYNAARNLLHKGVPFRMKVIRTTNIEDEAWKLERYFIQKFRKDGYKLYNCTYGGPDEFPMKINTPNKIKQVGIKIPKIKLKRKKIHNRRLTR
jgi:predicted GIY-YIG superfamily endonuclease